MCHASEYDHLLERAPRPVAPAPEPKPCLPSKPCMRAPGAPCAIHRPGVHFALVALVAR